MCVRIEVFLFLMKGKLLTYRIVNYYMKKKSRFNVEFSTGRERDTHKQRWERSAHCRKEEKDFIQDVGLG